MLIASYLEFPFDISFDDTIWLIPFLVRKNKLTLIGPFETIQSQRLHLHTYNNSQQQHLPNTANIGTIVLYKNITCKSQLKKTKISFVDRIITITIYIFI